MLDILITQNHVWLGKWGWLTAYQPLKIVLCAELCRISSSKVRGKIPFLGFHHFELTQLTIPFHISSLFTELYWMTLDLGPHTKCKGVHWNLIGGVEPQVWLWPPIYIDHFWIIARHVNHPESCMIVWLYVVVVVQIIIQKKYSIYFITCLSCWL